MNQEKAPTLRLPIARATRGAMFVLGTVMMVAGFTAVFYFVFPDAWSTLAPKDEIPVDGRVHELEVRAGDHMLLVVPTLGYIVGGVLFGSAGLTVVLAIGSNWARRHRAGRRALRTV